MDSEASYWTHLESTQRHWYPGFIADLSNQKGAQKEEGRAAAIIFQDEAAPFVYPPFPTSRDLRRYITRPFPPNYRRVFVLEGLPRTFIEVLGFHLQVPPSFFAEHWARLGQVTGDLMNHAPRQHDYGTRFSLTAPKTHWVKIQNEPGDGEDAAYTMLSSIKSLIHNINFFGDFEGPFRSSEKFSCWSRAEGNSWDVLLILVDPPLGKIVVGINSGQPRQVEPLAIDQAYPGASQGRSWYVPIPAANPLYIPEMKSMFDDIVKLYPHRQSQTTTDPLKATDICRQLILSTWVARLRIMEAEVDIKEAQMTMHPTMDMSNYRNWKDGSWIQAWKPRDFGGLVQAKTLLERMDTRILYNMDALGVGKTSCVIEEWEGATWNRLRVTLLTLKARVEILLQAYTQSASVRESQIANEQARQVEYLTLLATLFVPMSFVAAVFSMGGDYAVGEKSFYVFWATSLPIAVMTCIAFLFRGPIAKLILSEEGRSLWLSTIAKKTVIKGTEVFGKTRGK